MTKRELINLLEASSVPDDTDVVKSFWVANEDSTGYEEFNELEGVYSMSLRTSYDKEERLVLIV